MSVCCHQQQSGWYEGWMIHDLEVPPVGELRQDGTPQFGTRRKPTPTRWRPMGGREQREGPRLHARRQRGPPAERCDEF
jgi:hypothetical protein